jgi:hypothetical protein
MDVLAIDSRGLAGMGANPADVLVSIANMMPKGLLISKPTVTIRAWFDRVRRHYSMKNSINRSTFKCI